MKGNKNTTLLTSRCVPTGTFIPKAADKIRLCVHNSNYAQSIQKASKKTQPPTLIRPSKSYLTASKYLFFLLCAGGWDCMSVYALKPVLLWRYAHMSLQIASMSSSLPFAGAMLHVSTLFHCDVKQSTVLWSVSCAFRFTFSSAH